LFAQAIVSGAARFNGGQLIASGNSGTLSKRSAARRLQPVE